jgi:uncharacterized membrane protein (UPF0136 family)
MFNVVGYMNYRYFILFLGYVLVACVYGLLLTAGPFLGYLRIDRSRGRPIGGMNGTFFSARSATTYTFVLALSIGVAVGLLFFWHLYLVLTAQTTIEFYGNQTKAYRARCVTLLTSPDQCFKCHDVVHTVLAARGDSADIATLTILAPLAATGSMPWAPSPSTWPCFPPPAARHCHHGRAPRTTPQPRVPLRVPILRFMSFQTEMMFSSRLYKADILSKHLDAQVL